MDIQKLRKCRVLEARNENGNLYMLATSGTQEFRGGPPIELLKNSKKKV
jgi:hypothetical protein